MERISIAEDDPYLREELVLIFEKNGYAVTGISSFADAEKDIAASEPDLLVLDLNLPGRSGFELCRSFKLRNTFPILILTARDTMADELKAIGLGADDFLTKPCRPERLLARAARLLETYGRLKSIIQCGNMSLDTDTYKLIYGDKHLILPETEGKILRALMERHPGIVTQAELFENVWGTSEYLDENILQVNMTRLRKSLLGVGLKDCVVTVRGQGYCLEVAGL